MAIDKKIKGITIELDGDTKKLNDSFSEVDKKAKDIGASLKLVNEQLKLDPKNAEAAAQKLVLLQQKAANTSEKLETLKSVQGQIQQQYRDGVIDESQWVAFQTELAKTENQLNSTYRQIERLSGATNNAKKDIDNATESTSNWADVLKGSLLSDAITNGLQAMSQALVDFAKSSVEVGKNFDSSMSQVAATMGILPQGETFEKLTAAAEEMGATTKYTAAQAGDALNYLALAGYKADESIAALPTVLNLAQAGGMELAAASDMVTDSLSALGLEQSQMTEFTDKMAVTAQKSNTSVSQLGEAILTMGATAKDMKGGVTELNTMLGVLADNGIKGAEGGTKLRNAYLSLTAPTDKAAETLEKLKVSAYDANGAVRAMPDVLNDFNNALAGMEDQERIDIISTIFNARDIGAVNALLATSSDRYDELAGYIENSTGAAEQMAAVMNDNVEGAFASVNSAAEAFEKAVYDKIKEPLKDGANAVAELLRSMTEGLDPDTAEQIIADLGNALIDGLSNTEDMIRQASEFLIPALLSGINEQLPGVSEEAGKVIEVFVLALITALPYLAEGALLIVEGLVSGISENLPELLPVAIKAANTFVNGVLDNISTIIDLATQLIIALADGIIEALPEILKTGPTIMIRLASALINAIPKLLEAIPKIHSAIIEALTSIDWIETGKEMIASLLNALLQAVESAKNAFLSLGQTVFGYLFGDGGDGSGASYSGSYSGGGGKVGKVDVAENTAAMSGYKEAIDGEIETIEAATADLETAAEQAEDTVEETAVGLEEALDDLDHKLATHKISEADYWKRRKEVLEKFRDEESEEWWKEYDKVTDYYDKLAETEKAAAKKAEKERADLAKELADKAKKDKEDEIKKIEDSAKNLHHNAQIKNINGEYSDSEYYDYIENVLLPMLDKESTLYQQYEKEIAEGRKKIREERKKQDDADLKESEEYKKKAVKAAESEIDAIYDTYEAKYKELEKLKENAYKKFMSIGGNIFSYSKDDNGNVSMTIEDIKKQMKQMEDFYADVKNLKDSGASQSLISEILAMNDEEAAAWADYFSDMNTDEFETLNALYKKKDQYAKDLADMLYAEDENALGEGLKKELGEYYSGSDDANTYADDFIAALLERDSDFRKAFDDVLGGNIADILTKSGYITLPKVGDVSVPAVADTKTAQSTAAVTETKTAVDTPKADTVSTGSADYNIILADIYNLLNDIYGKLNSLTITVNTQLTLDGAVVAIAKKVTALQNSEKRITNG